MQNKFPKIHLLLSIIFLGAFVFIFAFFLREINNNNNEVQLAEDMWQKETLRREEIKTLNSSVKIIEEEIKELETHFAKSSDIVPFLDTMEKLATRAGTQAEVVSVNISEDRSGLLVGMKVSGNFEGLYKFLTLLENSPYELEFLSMNMSKGAVAENSNTKIPKWEALFKIKLLSFVP